MLKNITKKISTMLTAFILLSAIGMVAGLYIDMPIAYAAEEMSSETVETLAAATKYHFGFSYTKGNYVDGSTNSKFYSLQAGKNVRYKVATVEGATSSNQISLSLRYKDSNGKAIIVDTTKFYKAGTYNATKLVNTKKYYLYASGGGGYYIGADGDLECY